MALRFITFMSFEWLLYTFIFYRSFNSKTSVTISTISVIILFTSLLESRIFYSFVCLSTLSMLVFTIFMSICDIRVKCSFTNNTTTRLITLDTCVTNL